jgi:hypothetical protein
MFRTFSDRRPSSSDADDKEHEDYHHRQQIFTSKGRPYNGNRSNATTKISIADSPEYLGRDRSNETQTTGDSSGIYSMDMLTQMETLSEAGDSSSSSEQGLEFNIVNILGEDHDDDDGVGEVENEVDLDSSSIDTPPKSNYIPKLLYGGGSRFDNNFNSNSSNNNNNNSSSSSSSAATTNIIINKSSSWVEDKPFDEESIIGDEDSIFHMSEKGEGTRITNVMPVYDKDAAKEYILPPVPPTKNRTMETALSSSTSRDDEVEEILEITDPENGQKFTPRVVWSVENDKTQGNRSTNSSTNELGSSNGSQSTKSQSRRLKLRMAVCCAVTILIILLLAIVIPLSQKNADKGLQAAAASSASSSSGGEASTSSPSLPIPIVPTVAPSIQGTGSPPVSTPTETPEVPWADEAPNPSLEATPQPTPLPTGEPTPLPTPAPTPLPSAQPVPTEAPQPTITTPTCTSTISVFQECYFMSETVLVISFENCDPQLYDWIGIYPDGAEFQQPGSPTEYLRDDWIDWVWPCGDQECSDSPASASFALPIDPNDPDYNMLNLRAYLVRSIDGPTTVLAKSESFQVIDPCAV